MSRIQSKVAAAEGFKDAILDAEVQAMQRRLPRLAAAGILMAEAMRLVTIQAPLFPDAASPSKRQLADELRAARKEIRRLRRTLAALDLPGFHAEIEGPRAARRGRKT